jgi:branched-chain amino acid transport system substrate-binding protein
MKFLRPVAIVAAAAALLACAAAQADVTIGVTLCATGPAASLGIPEKNTVALLPKTIGGQTMHYIVLDDATDTTAAVNNMRKFVAQDKADAVVGSSVTPGTLAMTDVAAETGTPVISMAGSAIVVEPMDAKKHWAFKTPQNDAMMAQAIAQHMAASGVKTVGFIGFADAYGQGWYDEFAKAAKAKDIRIVANERYGRTDTSVMGQSLKILAARPDAVLVGASGTPAVLPQKTLKEHGYHGKFYQTHGVANADFLRVGGKDVEGTFLPAGPILVAEQLPDSNPVKKSALEYLHAYEAAYGKGTISTFGAHAWDAGVLLKAAIPVALKTAQPGTPQFRAALRDALENVKEAAGAQGIFNMTPTDHSGLDQRARVMVTVQNGAWKYLPDFH